MLAGPVGGMIGPVGGQMAWIWTAGWQDVGDFGQFVDVDILFSFFSLKISVNFRRLDSDC